LNGSIKPPGGENGRDGEASTFLAEGGVDHLVFFDVAPRETTEAMVRNIDRNPVEI